MNIKLVDDDGRVKEKLPKGEFCYKFFKDERFIGIAAINRDEEDKIYIYIKQELRGNGFGKLLFKELLKELKNKGIKSVKVKIDRKNIQIFKIIVDCGGINLSNDGEISSYIIPID